jgi:hypothetical protein
VAGSGDHAPHVTVEQIIGAFELEAFVVFVIVGVLVFRQSQREGRLTLLGTLFVGGLAVALFGDPVANWGLTALYSDEFMLLPHWMGWGLSPAQSWACVFAYPWCFPMLAYAGRWIARRLGFASPLAGFVAGGLFGFLNFVGSVVLTFIPNQVIVYQQAPPWPLTLRAGTPEQVQLLDILGITVFVGVLTALLMPAPGSSWLDRRLPRGSLARAGFGSALLLGLFLLAFSPALAVRALGLDTEVGFRCSPYGTVRLYGPSETYSQTTLDNFVANCRVRAPASACRCSIREIRCHFDAEQFRAMEVRMAKGERPTEVMAAVSGCH